MTDSKINIISWDRFTTRDLMVAPELLGLSHEFAFKNGLVKIELPSADKLPKEITDKSILQSHDSVLTIKSYREEDGRKIPLGILVNSVDVTVSLNATINLPSEVLTRHPNPVDLLSDKQRKRLDDISKSHRDVSFGAYDLWVRILRWKSNNGLICRPEVHGFKSGWSTYLLDDATRHRFWGNNDPLTVYLYEPITLSEWNMVEETLKLGQESPIYIDSMFDGIEQFKLGNLRDSVVYLAVACETFMRSKVIIGLPSGISSGVLSYIDEANIRQVQERLYKDTLNDKQKSDFKKINSNLHQLFDSRNAILHSGQQADLTSLNCQKYIETTKKLLSI